MLLLHGYMGHKKKVLARERGIASDRLRAFRESSTNEKHHLLGPSFDFFLYESGKFNEVERLATKRLDTIRM